jgi:spoIIIJ-associated protein
MSEIIIEEKSLQLALIKAAGALGRSQSELGYTVISEKKKFLGIFGGLVKVKAWGKSIKELSNTKDSSKVNLDDLQIYCEELGYLICKTKVKIKLYKNKDRVTFDFDSEYLAKQFTKSPKMYEAIEHILRKTFYKDIKSVRIFVDAKGVRFTQEKRLITLAKEYSERVCKSNKPITLSQKSPYDRRVIHMALEGDPRVYTKSVGSGIGRKLLIMPANAR